MGLPAFTLSSPGFFSSEDLQRLISCSFCSRGSRHFCSFSWEVWSRTTFVVGWYSLCSESNPSVLNYLLSIHLTTSWSNSLPCSSLVSTSYWSLLLPLACLHAFLDCKTFIESHCVQLSSTLCPSLALFILNYLYWQWPYVPWYPSGFFCHMARRVLVPWRRTESL